MMPTSRPALTAVRRRVERALLAIGNEQLASGEIPNFRRTGDDHWEYCFSPLPAALTHDALGVLDPLSSMFDAHALDQAAGHRRSVVGRLAARIRRRIRRFLAWQQRTDGTWRFYGHGSPLPSDLETTACAMAALLDGSDAQTIPGLASAGALRCFVCENGLFHSPGSRGDDAMPDIWRTRAANAHLLRCLILEGADGGELAMSLAADCARGNDAGAAALPSWQAIGRLYQRTRIEGLERAAQQGIQRLLTSWLQSPDRFMTPLASGLWLTVLLDFRCAAPIAAAADTVAHWLEMPMRRRHDVVLDPRSGSPGLTTAVGLAALARASAIMELG
jgi:hypothetical protein